VSGLSPPGRAAPGPPPLLTEKGTHCPRPTTAFVFGRRTPTTHPRSRERAGRGARGGAEKRRATGRARSALPGLTRCVCSSAANEVSGASYAAGQATEMVWTPPTSVDPDGRSPIHRPLFPSGRQGSPEGVVECEAPEVGPHVLRHRVPKWCRHEQPLVTEAPHACYDHCHRHRKERLPTALGRCRRRHPAPQAQPHQAHAVRRPAGPFACRHGGVRRGSSPRATVHVLGPPGRAAAGRPGACLRSRQQGRCRRRPRHLAGGSAPGHPPRAHQERRAARRAGAASAALALDGNPQRQPELPAQPAVRVRPRAAQRASRGDQATGCAARTARADRACGHGALGSAAVGHVRPVRAGDQGVGMRAQGGAQAIEHRAAARRGPRDRPAGGYRLGGDPGRREGLAQWAALRRVHRAAARAQRQWP
jgi:hypothetical protein